MPAAAHCPVTAGTAEPRELGRYPLEEQWRPLVATLLLLALLVASCTRAFWNKWLLVLWVVIVSVFFMLMYGNVLGLTKVTTDRWGGLPLTIMLSSLSMVMAFPLAIAVALGRRSKLPAIRTFCTIYVELIRGVPLISVLFMASFMFPLFMPQGVTIDVLIRVFAGLTLFAAAYMAEVVRGGLQAMPKGGLLDDACARQQPPVIQKRRHYAQFGRGLRRDDLAVVPRSG